MQEKESIMVVQYKLKLPSLRITVWHHEARLVMQNSYPHDVIFNPHLTIIKDSYKLVWFLFPVLKPKRTSMRLTNKAQRRKLKLMEGDNDPVPAKKPKYRVVRPVKKQPAPGETCLEIFLSF